MFDQMRIRSNLVFNKDTEGLFGFIDLGDPDVNFNDLEETDSLGTHTLAF